MAGDGALSSLAEWLATRTAAAPAALRRRVADHVSAAGATGDDAVDLARAARASLGGVLAAPGDRSVALDLLAADGLITLALLRQAEVAPAELVRFARSLTEGEGAA